MPSLRGELRRGLPTTLEAFERPAANVYYPRAACLIQARMDDLKPSARTDLLRSVARGSRQPDPNLVLVPARPLALHVLRNSYQQPDSWRVEFDARAFPLAPKQIRTCAVELYLWDARYLDPRTVDTRQPTGAGAEPLGAPLVVGLADEINSHYGDGRTVSIDGEDHTAIFARKEWDPKRRAPAGQRLDRQLEQLIREADTGGALQLRVDPPDLRASLPVVGAAARRTNKKGQPVREKSSWWDVMYRMAQLAGFILFVEGTDVVLSTPHVLHADRLSRVRRLAWGRNLTSLEMQRRMGKEVTPQIKAISWDERTQRRIEGVYPARGEQPTVGVREVGGKKDGQQTKIITVPGVTSEEVLRRYARAYYELVAAGEHSISCSTDDLRDLAGLDLLSLRSGDAVHVDLDAFNTEELARLDEGQRFQYLVGTLGYHERVASFVARNYDVVDVLREPVRLKEMAIDFSVDQGVSITMELHDYVRLPEGG